MNPFLSFSSLPRINVVMNSCEMELGLALSQLILR
jgi:hypothetical protein